MQVIDDDAQKTLVSLGTQSQEVKAVVGSEEWKTKTVAAASELGKMLGKKCVDAASHLPCLIEEDFCTTAE